MEQSPGPSVRPRERVIAALVAGAVAVSMAVTWIAFRRDLAASLDRLEGRSQLMATSAGTLEFTDVGEGPVLLSLHGTGGGFDQGLAMAAGIEKRGVRVIAPSRFGYLRSSWPADPSPARQADQILELLDRLGVGKVVIAGGSAGAVPAMHFALRHPERCAGLILMVPAANLENRDPVAMSPLEERMVRAALRSDLVFWLGIRIAPRQMIRSLLATDPVLLTRVSASERERAFAMLRGIMPVGAKWRGMLNDASHSGQPAGIDIARIGIPVLIISAEDDRFGTARTARQIASRLRQAKTIIFPTGGHLTLDHHDEVAAAMATFISDIALGRDAQASTASTGRRSE